MTGSSPRLRGTEAVPPAHPRSVRFIPAPAGNGRSPGCSRCERTVHPRACGERILGIGRTHVTTGSSPRLRGTDSTHSRHRLGERFIPAPAGNGHHGCRSHRPHAVHPRACGERSGLGNRDQPCYGSSPRLRGTGDRPTPAMYEQRFIPAPAGNGPVTPSTHGR